ncbi:hypothetical protein MTR00_08215 [Staphylococcus agnetis]|uniref:hypothetical protein n=1 Tax=Staphylococcus agnetis TaxID=985762 RepID=UPI00208E0CB2|nr:hypothetical protein [Staphylococcus agnetis]MCO4327085.1 hypothetical protein [Staphylococcus agnetis]MCO4369747.1 hypothetical protein [Staphylococcus agnetis]
MKKILSVLFVSTLVLSACGNQDETEKASEKKPSKSTVENKKENKEEKSTEEKQSSNTVEENQLSNTNTNNGESENKTNSNTQNINYNDPNTVVETYNGQTHVTTNNTVNEYYIPGETDPIYEREYKHFYTPEEIQRAQENSDAALREMGLEPERYE